MRLCSACWRAKLAKGLKPEEIAKEATNSYLQQLGDLSQGAFSFFTVGTANAVDALIKGDNIYKRQYELIFGRNEQRKQNVLDQINSLVAADAAQKEKEKRRPQNEKPPNFLIFFHT